MALKAGRVGVSPTEVDSKGKLITGGSITVVDNLNSTSSTDALSAKQGKVLGDKLDGFEFRTNEGVAQYRTSPTGEWVNFSSGVVLPSIEEDDANYSVFLIFQYRGATPISELTIEAYGSYSSGGGLSDLIGTCEPLEIAEKLYVCFINAKSATSSRIVYFRYLNGSNVIGLSTYSSSGSANVELGNIACNLSISANETGVETRIIY